MGRIFRPRFNNGTQDNARRDDGRRRVNWHAIPEVRVIDSEGKMIGIVETQQALQMARDAGLELINISPKATPPVCKIYDYGKYKYEQQKKQKGNRSTTKLKEIQFTMHIGANDLDIKLKKAIQFLEANNSVQLVMQLKGRDMPRIDVAMQLMQSICEKLESNAKQITEPKITGRKIIAMCN